MIPQTIDQIRKKTAYRFSGRKNSLHKAELHTIMTRFIQAGFDFLPQPLNILLFLQGWQTAPRWIPSPLDKTIDIRIQKRYIVRIDCMISTREQVRHRSESVLDVLERWPSG